ncbi:MAG: hypothetical protein HC798_03280 [Polaribacter sp.]|nr:hypothetical protein [Polaribacter sp.]
MGNAALVINTGQDINRKLAADITDGVVYASFLVNKDALSSGIASYFFHLGFYTNPLDLTTVSTNFRARCWVLAPAAADISKYRIGLTFNSATAADALATATVDLDKGTTYLVVVKYEFVAGADNDKVSLYLFNPGDNISKEPTIPTIGPLTGTSADATSIQNAVLRQAHAQQGTTVDGVIVRTEWNLTSAGQDIDNVWTGATDTDWATGTNWTSGVPTGSSNVLIPAVATNYPIATGAVTVNSATIGANALLNAESTFTGTVKYERFFINGNWHLVSSPVSGQSFNDAFVTANSMAISGANNGISSYNTGTNNWSYMSNRRFRNFYKRSRIFC